MIGSIPLLLVVGLFLLPGAQAQMAANQGALTQTKAELSGFRFPLSVIQDEMRRDPRVKLDPSIALYREALARDPDNGTALRRLAPGLMLSPASGDELAQRTPGQHLAHADQESCATDASDTNGHLHTATLLRGKMGEVSGQKRRP